MAARLMAIAAASLAGLGMVGEAQATIVADGKEWAEPADFTGLTWNSIAGVCPAGGGQCTGAIGSKSFLGWTWATVEEVGSLFHYFESSFPDNGVAQVSLSSPNSIETSFFAQFIPSYTTSAQRYVGGWAATSDPADGNKAYKPFVNDLKNPASQDIYRTSVTVGKNTYQAIDGAWLYRVTEVPLPATLPLFMSALLGSGAVLRRRRYR